MQELALDGEILDDDVDPQILRLNEMEMKARHLLLQQQSMKSTSSTSHNNQETIKTEKGATGQKVIPGIPVPTNASACSSIPDEMLCIMCMDRRKEIMI